MMCASCFGCSACSVTQVARATPTHLHLCVHSCQATMSGVLRRGASADVAGSGIVDALVSTLCLSCTSLRPVLCHLRAARLAPVIVAHRGRACSYTSDRDAGFSEGRLVTLAQPELTLTYIVHHHRLICTRRYASVAEKCKDLSDSEFARVGLRERGDCCALHGEV